MVYRKNRKAHFQNLSNSFLMGMKKLGLRHFPFSQNFWLSVQLVEMSMVRVGRWMEIIWKKRPLQVLHFFCSMLLSSCTTTVFSSTNEILKWKWLEKKPFHLMWKVFEISNPKFGKMQSTQAVVCMDWSLALGVEGWGGGRGGIDKKHCWVHKGTYYRPGLSFEVTSNKLVSDLKLICTISCLHKEIPLASCQLYSFEILLLCSLCRAKLLYMHSCS